MVILDFLFFLFPVTPLFSFDYTVLSTMVHCAVKEQLLSLPHFILLSQECAYAIAAETTLVLILSTLINALLWKFTPCWPLEVRKNLVNSALRFLGQKKTCFFFCQNPCFVHTVKFFHTTRKTTHSFHNMNKRWGSWHAIWIQTEALRKAVNAMEPQQNWVDKAMFPLLFYR